VLSCEVARHGDRCGGVRISPVLPPTLRCCRFFGWTKANEINNGRWVMFGFAVGLLTEFATGARQLVFAVRYPPLCLLSTIQADASGPT